MRRSTFLLVPIALLVAGLVEFGCSASSSRSASSGNGAGGNGNVGGGGGGGGACAGGSGGTGEPGPGARPGGDTGSSYMGCDYWPTAVPNNVWSIFDFAVIVANPGNVQASVHVTGPKNTDVMQTIEPGAAEKIFLPWVDDLKGPES